MALICTTTFHWQIRPLYLLQHGAPLEAGRLCGHRATAPRITYTWLKKDGLGIDWIEKGCEHNGRCCASGALFDGLDTIKVARTKPLVRRRKPTMGWVSLDTGPGPVEYLIYEGAECPALGTMKMNGA